MKKLFNLFAVLLMLSATMFVLTSFVSCGDSGTSSSSSEDDSSSNSGTSSSSSGYIYVAVSHSGKSGVTILSKKAVVGGQSVSSNGTGTSSYSKINVSGRLSYTTYQSYKKGSGSASTSTYNERSGGGTYNFSNGGKYTINCANGNVTKN